MTTCPFCGSEIADGAKFCTSCGASLASYMPAEQPAADAYQQQPYQQPTYQQPFPSAQQTNAGVVPQTYDSGSFGWAVLGFFIPIAGLILFLVWRTTKPKCAKMAGIGALVGFILGVVSQAVLLGSAAGVAAMS